MAIDYKARYKELRAAGKCVNCHTTPTEKGKAMCEGCRTKKRFRNMVASRKFRAIHGRAGKCRRCNKPSGIAYCAPCKRIKNDLRAAREGHGGLRQHQKADKYIRVTIGRMQYELGSYWVETKDWVMDHLEVFDEAPDWALYISRPFMEGEDFADERTRN